MCCSPRSLPSIVTTSTMNHLLLQVIRCFEDDNVHHVNGKVDPVGDADTINFELALADITQIEKRMQRLVKGGRKSKEEVAAGEVSSC